MFIACAGGVVCIILYILFGQCFAELDYSVHSHPEIIVVV